MVRRAWLQVQRQVLARRAALVGMLYADPVPAGVIVAGKTP